MSAKRETDSKFASALPFIGRYGTTWLPHRLPPLLRIGQFSHAGFRSRQCACLRARSLSRACVLARRTLLRSGCVHAHEHACTRVENARTRRYIHACERRGALARPRLLFLPPSHLRFLTLSGYSVRSIPARMYRVFSANGSTVNEFLAPALPLVFILERLLYRSIGYFFPR